jgi:hypothetical protein
MQYLQWMKNFSNILRTCIATATLATLAGLAPMTTDGTAPRSGGQIGPDVVCWITADGHAFYGSVDGIGGYSTGTTSCNYGDVVAAWYGGTTETPLIAQNAYRLHQGRFEQIGMSWLKHSFCALSQGGCGDCQETDCDTLGIGCADTYGAGLNANGTGPRSVVNAFTGDYPYPFGLNSSGPNAIRGNLQIHDVDMEPALNQGARYFIEGQYVCPDEAEWSTQYNNCSWREVLVTEVGAMTNLGETKVEDAAIKVWADIDPDVVETEHIVPGDGLVILSAKATDLGNGFHRYEYACFNQNCHRSIGRFLMPIPKGATVQNVGFHDVDYHSGEVIDGTNWTPTVDDEYIEWRTVDFEENELANAIRWGTLYNFRVDVSAEPMLGEVRLSLFRPGPDPEQYLSSVVPSGAIIDPCALPIGPCPMDINDDTTVGVDDLLAVIGGWNDCGDGSYRPEADVDDDCCVTVDDLLLVIGNWGAYCGPVGACCLPDGGCTETDQITCEDDGGAYQGDDTDCAMTTCPQPGACCFDDDSCERLLPEICDELGGTYRGPGTNCDDVDCSQSEYNDDCVDSWVITNGQHDFQTLTATTDGTLHPECKFDGQTYNDIWFRYTATTSGTLVVSTCNSADYDTDLVLYAGWECYDFQLINCSDDGPGCEGYTSYMETEVTAGDQYMIRVGGWESGNSGTGVLLVEPTN